MLAKKFKLSLGEFLAKKRRPVAESPLFSVLACGNTLGANRVGVVIGGKIEKSAVRRHSISRIIFNEAASWPNMGLDICILARLGAAKVPKEEMQKELARLVSLLTPNPPARPAGGQPRTSNT